MDGQTLATSWQARIAQMPNFEACVTQFGLSAFEAELLALCVAAALERETTNMLMQVHGKPYVTFVLAMQMLEGSHADALSPERSLRFWHLLDLIHAPEVPSTLGALRIDERILNDVQGFGHLDGRLRPYLFEMSGAQTTMDLPESQAVAVRRADSVLSGDAVGGRLPIIQLVGIDAQSKQLIVQRAAERLGVRLYHLPTELLPKSSVELDLFARLWAREGLLSPVALYLDAHELDLEREKELITLVQRFLTRSAGLFFLSSREALHLGLPTQTLDVKKPTRAEQISLWQAQLGEGSKALSARLAGQFNLSLPAIEQVGQVVQEESTGTLPTLWQVWQACLVQTRPRLDMLAQRIVPKATWENIVLPDAQMDSLRKIAAQVEKRGLVYDEWGWRQRVSRGLGMTVLFAGDSGTGKTLAAEILANQLNFNLYRIDLSQVVSKYIGETEKNLRKLFDAAEDGGAILFFDEADSLFGKRGDAKTSNDRYANMETNYLLQRLESYQGLAILATNLLNNLDDAFMRRLRFIIKFPVPENVHRELIWQRIFPAGTPLETLDYSYLATFKLTGGSIYNAALNGSFMAASDGKPVAMPHLLEAIQMEFDKSGRLRLNSRLFQWPR